MSDTGAPTVGASLTTEEPSLCAHCRSIPWSQIAKIRRAVSNSGEYLSTISASREQLQRSTCRVCQGLALVRPDGASPLRLTFFSAARALGGPKQRSLGLEDCALIGFKRSTTDGFTECEENAGCFAVVPKNADIGNLTCGPRIIEPDKIDFDLVRRWLSYCSLHHACGDEARGRPAVRELRVIDCLAWSVIPLPQDFKYVALSYVWGPDSSGKSELLDSSKLPDKLERVVRDSISVTLALGFRYLWVDRHVSILHAFHPLPEKSDSVMIVHRPEQQP